MKEKMVKALLMFSFLISIPYFVLGQETPSQAPDVGTMDVYDEWSDPSNPTKPLTKARLHINQAWTAKKQETIRVVRYTREGVKTTCSFSIEKSEKGAWQIVTKCISKGCPWGPKSCVKAGVREDIFNGIEVIGDLENPKQNGSGRIVLTNSETGRRLLL